MSESDNSPVQRTGVILWRSCGKGRFAPFCGVDSVSVRCELVEIAVGGFRTEGAGEAGGGGGSIMRAAMANLPFARMMSWEVHSCRMLVAIEQAQKTNMMSPALMVPLRTSDAPNQKPWMNIAM